MIHNSEKHTKMKKGEKHMMREKAMNSNMKKLYKKGKKGKKK